MKQLFFCKTPRGLENDLCCSVSVSHDLMINNMRTPVLHFNSFSPISCEQDFFQLEGFEPAVSQSRAFARDLCDLNFFTYY